MKLVDACLASANKRAYACYGPELRCYVELRDNSLFAVDSNGALSDAPLMFMQIARLYELDWYPCISADDVANASVLSLNALRDQVHELAKSKGWHENFDLVVKGAKPDKLYGDTAKIMHIAGCLANIHGEVSEALECLRVDGMDDISFVDTPANGAKPEGFAIELADVLIRVLDLCGLLEIDIDDAVRRKHEYNKTRPYRHGGKAL